MKLKKPCITDEVYIKILSGSDEYNILLNSRVVHGKWIEFGNKIECPFCKYSTRLIGVDKYNYCPNCGADMRNKEE